MTTASTSDSSTEVVRGKEHSPYQQYDNDITATSNAAIQKNDSCTDSTSADHGDFWLIQTLVSGQERFVFSSYCYGDDDGGGEATRRNPTKTTRRYFRTDNVEIFPKPNSLRRVVMDEGATGDGVSRNGNTTNDQETTTTTLAEELRRQFQAAQEELENARKGKQTASSATTQDSNTNSRITVMKKKKQQSEDPSQLKVRPKPPPSVPPGGRWYHIPKKNGGIFSNGDSNTSSLLLLSILTMGVQTIWSFLLTAFLVKQVLEEVYVYTPLVEDHNDYYGRVFYDSQGAVAFLQNPTGDVVGASSSPSTPAETLEISNQTLVLMPPNFSPLGYESYIDDDDINHKKES